MNVSDLKLKIFREIDSLEASRLEEFYGVMLNFVNGRKEDDEWIGLSETEITGIEDAIDELDAGKGIPHDQVLTKFRDIYNHA
ncbi:MAG TPA: hypothetical protein DER09_11250 [Prolixibacteraceae bacterium]|nr:hypothetical protein [Prolixibacteraceae bacterium]